MTSTTPVRHPDTKSPRLMTKRAWWLVVLNLLIPGSAQVLAGSRRLGRFGLGATLVLWLLVAAGLALFLLDRELFITVTTNTIVLGALVLAAVFYGVLWLVLTLDTVRLVRLVRVPGGPRAAVAVLALAGMAATVGGAGYAAVNGFAALGLLQSVFADGTVEPPIDGRYNILLLGGDAGADRVGLRPDSISVVSVSAETGQATIIGIPRNLQNTPFPEDSPLHAEFPDGYSCDDCLIDYLYTYGVEHPDLYPDAASEGSDPGVEAMRDAAEGVTGLPIQYYVLIDMQGFVQLIDALGGIDITVQERLPIGGSVDADGDIVGVNVWIEPGPQHMDGNTALWYARSRISTDDYDRMRRQREVQEAILRQFEPANVLTKFQAVAAAGAQVVRTDIPQAMLGRFVDIAEKSREFEITKLELTPPTIETFAPDYELIRSLVQQAVPQPTPSPSP